MAFPMENQFETFTAERLHVQAHTILSQYPMLAENAELKMMQVNDSVDQLVLMMKSWMLAGRIPTNESSHTFSYPDGTWQMLKELHLPEWFKRKFPVRYKRETVTVTTNHYFVCPHLSVPNQGRHVQFMATGTDMAARMCGGYREQ